MFPLPSSFFCSIEKYATLHCNYTISMEVNYEFSLLIRVYKIKYHALTSSPMSSKVTAV